MELINLLLSIPTVSDLMLLSHVMQLFYSSSDRYIPTAISVKYIFVKTSRCYM